MWICWQCRETTRRPADASVYETEVSAQQSKKKAVRRNEFTDTDNNAADASVVDYSDPVEESMGPHGPEDGQDPPTLRSQHNPPIQVCRRNRYRGKRIETQALKPMLL